VKLIKRNGKNKGFTIIEILTIMSIIVLLISLLVPALNQVKRFAKDVKQKNQFHSIEVALEMFNAEWEDYPDSAPPSNKTCGATQLAEALVGRDMQGYDPTGSYNVGGDLSNRRFYLPIENANVFALDDLYSNIEPIEPNVVLCDVYKDKPLRNVTFRRKAGMPILYYKANTSGSSHDPENYADESKNFYNHTDNEDLVKLGLRQVADVALIKHALGDGGDWSMFYRDTKNDLIDEIKVPDGRPYKVNSFILQSAGNDGNYGTNDDIYNFEK